MALTLGSVFIPTGLVWKDRNAYSPVAQSVNRTLGGRAIVRNTGLAKGRPITLVSLEDQGYVLHDNVLALQTMSNEPGAVYNLIIGAESFNVIFRHEEAPAFSAVPLIERSVQEATDYYKVTIKLMTV